MRSDRPGFTLVELLVVISIIVLLIVMLLPALALSRESANQIACMSRMHQLHLLTTSYQSDENNYYVSGRFYEGPGNWLANFGSQVKRYLPAGVDNIYAYDCTPRNNLFLCPNTKYRNISPMTPAYLYQHVYPGTGYIMGYNGVMQFGGGNGSVWNQPYQIARYFPKNQLNRPYPIAYFMETAGSSPYLLYTTVGPVKYNHFNNTGTNVVFSDGQIKAYKEDLQTAIDAGRLKVW